MFYLVLMKAKVGASWCDLYYTYSSYFFLFSQYQFFWNWVGFEKETKKRHTQAFQFLQLVVHMYFVPVTLFILEIKGKKIYIGKKIVWPLNVASPRPGLDLGLLVVSCNFFFVVVVFVFFWFWSLKDAWFWFYFDLYMSLNFVNQFQFSGGLGSSKSW